MEEGKMLERLASSRSWHLRQVKVSKDVEWLKEDIPRGG
jgi:hypothetical protein